MWWRAISPRPLLAVARARGAGLEASAGAPIAFIEADAQSHDFGASVFEHAISRFGIMFFDDSAAAFANIRKAPGSRWQPDLPVLAANRGQSLDHRAEGTSSYPSCRNPSRVLRTRPGRSASPKRRPFVPCWRRPAFRDITVEAVDRPLTLARSGDGAGPTAAEAAADFATELGPVSRLLRDQPASIREGRSAQG